MDEALEKIYVNDIQAGMSVQSPFLMTDIRLGQTKNGKPYISLKLKDRTGEIEARVWDNAEGFHETFKNGMVAWVAAAAESFQGRVQLKIERAGLMDEDQVDASQFLPASRFDPDAMFEELCDLASRMENPHLKGVLMDFFEDADFEARLKRAPAAKRFHHAYIGGLLEHTLSVARGACAVSDLYPVLNRDLLLTGAILHDIGKVWEFDQGLEGDYTDEGRFLGHLVIGVRMLEEKITARPDFPVDLALLLKHMIVSHHGEYELGSPKKPKILEALALHQIDDLDAKMNGIGDYIVRHADQETGWTDFNRLMGRFFYKHDLPAGGEWSALDASVNEREPGAESGEEPDSADAREEQPVERKRAAVKKNKTDERPSVRKDDLNTDQMSFLTD